MEVVTKQLAQQVKKVHGGRQPRQYTDLDMVLIKAGELSSAMISEQTGTKSSVIDRLRYRLKKKAEKAGRTVAAPRKYTKKAHADISTEIAIIPKQDKTAKIIFNGIELRFEKAVKSITYLGNNCLSIES